MQEISLFFLAMPHAWDGTSAPCNGSVGSQPLGHQRISKDAFLKIVSIILAQTLMMTLNNFDPLEQITGRL